MRLALGAVLAGLAVAAAPAYASTTASPTLRVGFGPSLTIIGQGFTPRALVKVTVGRDGVARRASIRAGTRGGFVLRFTGLERCSADSVTASTASGLRARVPLAWFVRECPPPPPLAPAVSSAN